MRGWKPCCRKASCAWSSRLGRRTRLPLGGAPSGPGRRHRLYGNRRLPGALGRLAGASARHLPGLPLAQGRRPDPEAQPVHRRRPAQRGHARALGRGNGGLPQALYRRRRGAATDADLAAPDPDRRRAGGGRRDRRGLRRRDEGEPDPETFRQRQAGQHPDRPGARVLPELGQPGRGHGEGTAFRPGGFARRIGAACNDFFSRHAG